MSKNPSLKLCSSLFHFHAVPEFHGMRATTVWTNLINDKLFKITTITLHPDSIIPQTVNLPSSPDSELKLFSYIS